MKEKITLFKFWAPWCPHCQAVNRFYPKLVADMSDKFNFEDIDTTAGNNVLAARFCTNIHLVAQRSQHPLRGEERRDDL